MPGFFWSTSLAGGFQWPEKADQAKRCRCQPLEGVQACPETVREGGQVGAPPWLPHSSKPKPSHSSLYSKRAMDRGVVPAKWIFYF